jgi:hypothetical protein
MSIERYVPGRARFLVGESRNPINRRLGKFFVAQLTGKLNCKEGEHKELLVLVSRHRSRQIAEQAATRLTRYARLGLA